MDKFNFDNMLKLAFSKPELTAKIENIGGVDVTIFSYMVQMTDTFENPLSLEFRGSVFRNDTGECISRPLPKFFNVGEKPETQQDKIDFKNVKYFTKHDGSMAVPVLINDEIFWKTKKSFFSDVAIKIQKYYNSQEFYYLKEILKNGFTPIFEYVGPDNRIVLEYKKEELILLGVRDNSTGVYIPNLEHKVNVEYSNIYNMEEIEGFVIYDDSKLIKSKTKWYLDRHSIVTEFNPKRMIQSVLDDSIDDIIGTVYQLGFQDRGKEIEELRDKTLKTKLQIIHDCGELFNTLKIHKNRKEFAGKVQEFVVNEYKPILFKMFSNDNYDNIVDKITFERVYSKYKSNGEK